MTNKDDFLKWFDSGSSQSTEDDSSNSTHQSDKAVSDINDDIITDAIENSSEGLLQEDVFDGLSKTDEEEVRSDFVIDIDLDDQVKADISSKEVLGESSLSDEAVSTESFAEDNVQDLSIDVSEDIIDEEDGLENQINKDDKLGVCQANDTLASEGQVDHVPPIEVEVNKFSDASEEVSLGVDIEIDEAITLEEDISMSFDEEESKDIDIGDNETSIMFEEDIYESLKDNIDEGCLEDIASNEESHVSSGDEINLDVDKSDLKNKKDSKDIKKAASEADPKKSIFSLFKKSKDKPTDTLEVDESAVDGFDSEPPIHLCPKDIYIEYINDVPKPKNALDLFFAKMVSHLEGHASAFYHVSKYKNGYFVEAHVGGPKRPYSPSIVKSLKKNEFVPVYLKLAAGNFVEVRKDPVSNIINCDHLPIEIQADALKATVKSFAKPSKGKMKAYQPKGVEYLLVGSVIGIFGLAAAVSAMISYTSDTSLWMHPRMQTTSLKDLPYNQWPLLQTTGPNVTYIGKLEYKKGEWSVQRIVVNTEKSVEGKIDAAVKNITEEAAPPEIRESVRQEPEKETLFTKEDITSNVMEMLKNQAAKSNTPIDLLIKRYVDSINEAKVLKGKNNEPQ